MKPLTREDLLVILIGALAVTVACGLCCWLKYGVAVFPGEVCIFLFSVLFGYAIL